MNALDKVLKARAALVTAHTFFGVAAINLALVPDANTKTASVDGITLRFNPDYVLGLTMPETMGLVAHETCHPLLGHIGRMAGRDRDTWNRATDFVINPMLRDAGLTLPKGALFNPDYANKSADEVYALEMGKKKQEQGRNAQPAPQGKPGQAQGSPQPGNSQNAPSTPQNAQGQPGQGQPSQDFGGTGDMQPAPSPSGKPEATPAELADLDATWKIRAVQAANAARAAGTISAAEARAVDQLKAPKVDWREILRRFICSASPSDYSWFPPNRRHIAAGLYLPALKPDRLSAIAFMNDTSGSITDEQQAQVNAELNAVLEDVRPERIYVIHCDRKVRGVEEFTPDDLPIMLDAKGGGGTDFRPPFAYIDGEQLDIVCAVYLSDLDAPAERFPVEPSAYPVLWISTTDRVAPFGETVRLTPDI